MRNFTFLIRSRRVVVVGIAIGTLLLIFVAIMLIGTSATSGAAGELYREAVVTRGSLREVIGATGPISANRNSQLSFLLSGPIQDILVKDGERVQKDQLLLRLDTSEIEADIINAQIAIQLQQLAYNQLIEGPDKYDVAAARAAVAQSASQLNLVLEPPNEQAVRLAQQNYELQQNNLWRVQAARDQWSLLYPNGNAVVDVANQDVASAEISVKVAEQELINAQQGSSSSDVLSARASLGQAQATLNRLLEGPTEVDLKLADVQLQQAQLSLDLANSTLQNALIVAPFNGVVGAISFDPGEQIAQGVPVLTLIDDSSFYIDVLIDEVDIARIAVGQPATVTLDAYSNDRIPGHVLRIAPDSVTVNKVVSYQVRILIDETNIPLRDGMTGTIDIVVSELTNVLLVPNWAIRIDRETGIAYVPVRQPDGQVIEVVVELGQRGEESTEILGGLIEGDVIAVSQERQVNLLGTDQ